MGQTTFNKKAAWEGSMTLVWDRICKTLIVPMTSISLVKLLLFYFKVTLV